MNAKTSIVAMLLIVLATTASAEEAGKPPIVIVTANPQKIQPILSTIAQDWSPYQINVTNNPTIVKVIGKALEQVCSEHRGAILLNLPMRYANLALQLAQNMGVNMEPIGSNTQGVYTIYSIDRRYAIVTVPGSITPSPRMGALLSVLSNIRNTIGNAGYSSGTGKRSLPGNYSTRQEPTSQNPSTDTQQKSNSHQSTNTGILNVTPPEPMDRLPNILEKNVAITLPSYVRVLKISGVPYPVKDIRGSHVAILPKDAVPNYFSLQIHGVCAEIIPSRPDAANATCAGADYATVCAWTKNEGDVTTVSISAASKIAHAISYDLFLPKTVAEDVNTVEGNYITIVRDPVLRIYLHATDGNVAVNKIKILNTNKTFAPIGAISFGACDTGVSDLNVTHVSGKDYKVQFQITDKYTPVYAQHVVLYVDNRAIIPQRDGEVAGYSANVRLSPGEHIITVTAEIPGCGEIRYAKEISVGEEEVQMLWVVALIVVIVAYVILKTVEQI